MSSSLHGEIVRFIWWFSPFRWPSNSYRCSILTLLWYYVHRWSEITDRLLQENWPNPSEQSLERPLKTSNVQSGSCVAKAISTLSQFSVWVSLTLTILSIWSSVTRVLNSIFRHLAWRSMVFGLSWEISPTELRSFIVITKSTGTWNLATVPFPLCF